jgi:hypothetical protein
MTTILGAFNNHFIEFLEDVHKIFPNNNNIRSAKTAILLLKKTNPRAVITLWKTYISKPYKQQIEHGDISFFINKDYSNDLVDVKDSNNTLKIIEQLREPVTNMGAENQLKAIKYIQNLTKISDMYM